MSNKEKQPVSELQFYVAVNALYFGDRSNPALWEAVRVAGNFPTLAEEQAEIRKEP